MAYWTRRADLTSEEDVDDLKELHKLTFASIDPLPEFDDEAWWLMFHEETPIAFAGVVPASNTPGHGYLKRAGVLGGYQGHGLQRRLLCTREAYARRQGWHTLVTDTIAANHFSANNLIRAGFTLYTPTIPWGLKGALYWRKPLVRVLNP